VINWKLACVPLLANIKGHSEPRVFKFQRRDMNDDESPVVMRVKLHMAAIHNEAYFPKDGWEVWKSDDRPEINDMTFLPKKKIDVDGLRTSLEFLKKKKYIPPTEIKQVEVFLKKKEEQNASNCDVCMNFRAIQLTHKSSKAHTDDERIKHRRVRDATTDEFDKHLFDERKSHEMPTREECWPIGFYGEVNRYTAPVIVDDTDSDTDGKDLKDGELYADQIGKEVMSVGRVQYEQLKPLKLGNMVALYANDPTNAEDFFVGKAMKWDKHGGEDKLLVHWYGYKTNGDAKAEDRKYYRGEREKNSTKHKFWVGPRTKLAKGREWIERVKQDALVFWKDETFLNAPGTINQYALRRIQARVAYVKNNLGH
jgi:hypothetical protein